MATSKDIDSIESHFIKKFKELKKQRNNHLIDEPDFDEAVEQLAADEYGHNTLNGWCCACEADQAFMEAEIERRVKLAPTSQPNKEEE